MSNCVNCGSFVPDNQRFCPQCGQVCAGSPATGQGNVEQSIPRGFPGYEEQPTGRGRGVGYGPQSGFSASPQGSFSGGPQGVPAGFPAASQGSYPGGPQSGFSGGPQGAPAGFPGGPQSGFSGGPQGAPAGFPGGPQSGFSGGPTFAGSQGRFSVSPQSGFPGGPQGAPAGFIGGPQGRVPGGPQGWGAVNVRVCQRCRSPLGVGMRFCEKCGAPSMPPVAPTVANGGAVRSCTVCGVTLGWGMSFCQNCGTRWVEPSHPSSVAGLDYATLSAGVDGGQRTSAAPAPQGNAKCGKCGGVVLHDERFCSTCGAPNPEQGAVPAVVAEISSQRNVPVAEPQRYPVPTAPLAEPQGLPVPNAQVGGGPGYPVPTAPVAEPQGFAVPNAQVGGGPGYPVPTAPVAEPQGLSVPNAQVGGGPGYPVPTAPLAVPQGFPVPSAPVGVPQGFPASNAPVDVPQGFPVPNAQVGGGPGLQPVVTDPRFDVSVRDDACVIKAYKGSDSEVLVPAEIGGKPVVEIGKKAFAGKVNLRSVVLPDSVQRIEQDAFAGCEFQSVTLGAGLCSFGLGAFSGCAYLGSVHIPDGVKVIPGRLFENCTSLVEVSGLTNVTRLGASAFAGCQSLVTIELPSVESVGIKALANCQNLRSVTFGPQLREIGKLAFEKDASLVGLGDSSNALPDSLAVIDRRAFAGCRALATVVLPAGLQELRDSAFDGCCSLVSVSPYVDLKVCDVTAFDGCDALDERSALLCRVFTGRADKSELSTDSAGADVTEEPALTAMETEGESEPGVDGGLEPVVGEDMLEPTSTGEISSVAAETEVAKADGELPLVVPESEETVAVEVADADGELPMVVPETEETVAVEVAEAKGEPAVVVPENAPPAPESSTPEERDAAWSNLVIAEETPETEATEEAEEEIEDSFW